MVVMLRLRRRMRALLVHIGLMGWSGTRRGEGRHPLHALLRLCLHDRARFVTRLRRLRMFDTRHCRGCKLLMRRQLPLLLHGRLPLRRLGLGSELAVAGVAARKCIARRHAGMCAVGCSCLLLRCPRLCVHLRHVLLCGLQVIYPCRRCSRGECRYLHARRTHPGGQWLHRMARSCQGRNMRQRRWRWRCVQRYRTAWLQHLCIEMRCGQMRIVGRAMQLGGRRRWRGRSCKRTKPTCAGDCCR